jgi:L-glutamine-phosphate cytidylyltransferase
MKGIILAAGRGSRMGSLTSNLPKCRTLLFGKELINWQLDALTDAGLSEIAIIRGYLSETFDFNVTYFENKRWANTNMVSTLISANQWLEAETNIISYADIVYSSDSVLSLIGAKGDIVITYDPNWFDLWSLRFKDPLSDAETFKIRDDVITEIGNKAISIQEIEGQFMGLIKITVNGWKKISQYLNGYSSIEIDQMDMTMLLSGLINYGVDIHATPISDKWMEVDSESDLKIYQKEYKSYYDNTEL